MIKLFESLFREGKCIFLSHTNIHNFDIILLLKNSVPS